MNLKQRLLHLFTDHNDKLCPLVENFLLDAADPNCLGWADGGVLFEAYSFNDAKCTPYQVVSTFAKQVNSGLFNVQKDRPRDWIYVRDYKAAAEKLGGQEDAMQGPSTCTCLSGFSPALRGPFKLAAEVADLHGNMEGWPQMETMKQVCGLLSSPSLILLLGPTALLCRRSKLLKRHSRGQWKTKEGWKKT